ncbi:MAG: zinc ribbon domain-containing protein [Candidatus Binatia bacterium]
MVRGELSGSALAVKRSASRSPTFVLAGHGLRTGREGIGRAAGSRHGTERPVRCSVCSTENPPEDRFCEQCAAALSAECPACGRPGALQGPAPEGLLQRGALDRVSGFLRRLRARRAA